MLRFEYIVVVIFYKVDYLSLLDVLLLVEELGDLNVKYVYKWCIYIRRCKYKLINVCYLVILLFIY